MKTMVTKLMNRRHRISQAATVLLIGWMIAFSAVLSAAADSVSTEAGPESPAQTAYAPANGPGPVIIVISGQTGPTSYKKFASEVAALGYYSVLLDGKDILKECCVIESMRAMETAAKDNGMQFELVVYPEANHGFNLEKGASGEPASAYRHDDDRDAWRRTVKMLKLYHPLQEKQRGAVDTEQQ